MDVRADAELVRAVMGGDRLAFASLVRRYERGVRATTRRVLRDAHLADDAAQEAFVAAYEGLGKLRDPSAFAAWLLRIAQQRAVRIWKKARASDRPDRLPQQSGGNRLSSSAPFDDETEHLVAAVDALPEHERVVVMLRYFEDHDVQTIAAILNRPVSTITKQLSRAHERLRQRLRRDDQR